MAERKVSAVGKFVCQNIILTSVRFLFNSVNYLLTFRHRASCILGQAFHYSSENAFYIFNQQIYLII